MNYYNPSQSWHAGSGPWSVKAFVCCLSYHGRWNSHSTTVAWPDAPLSAQACIFYLQRMFCLFTCYHCCINGKKGISFLSLAFWRTFFARDGSDATSGWAGGTEPALRHWITQRSLGDSHLTPWQRESQRMKRAATFNTYLFIFRF